jgi:superfamily II RNA helicase
VGQCIVEKEFKLDDFQLEAIEHIKKGTSVITCAPTGAGKTVIAKQAIKMALAENKKVFYTAPLKALINQKFDEFSKEFGGEKVGIITGDTNRNRDAQIIVMTTEIYRNMLYGTTFGSIDPFLKELKYLIFDEFHYINDSSRGTVWEESVIYSPKDIQLIALSATINNPEELVEWIKSVHGDCTLVKTEKRPVPLYHYYFKDNQLAPLMTPNGKLNPKLKERDDNKFSKHKGKFGKRFNNEPDQKANIPDVVMELNKKDMLPAIYFVFSRKGCDKAVRECENLNLLKPEEQKELNKLIDEAIAFTPVIKNFNQLELLRKGVAAHHAGLLPQVKSLIEELFTKALVKVVFSTETLAAGINMPARSTVISSINKASDSGFRNLTASEFLQMSGRAGRRGLDENGYVITIKTGQAGAGEISLLANSKPEDVSSHFRASYEMVLNLLLGHSYEEIKGLVQKSFGQYLVSNTLNNEEEEKKRLEAQLIEAQHPLCPGEIGDLSYYYEMQAKLDETRRRKKEYEKNLDPRVDELEATLEIVTMEAKSYPCNGCPKQKPCSKQMDKIKRYKKQVRDIDAKILDIKNMNWENFQKVINLLKKEAYIDDNYKVTEKGRTCASLRSDNSYYLSEIVNSDLFDGLNAKEFAGLISCFVIGEARVRDRSFQNVSKICFNVEKKSRNVARQVIQAQRTFGVDRPVDYNPAMSGYVEEWANGTSWDDLTKNTLIDEGDILRCIRRTVDVSKQISKAPNINTKLKNLAEEAIKLIERDLVLEVF